MVNFNLTDIPHQYYLYDMIASPNTFSPHTWAAGCVESEHVATDKTWYIFFLMKP